MYSRRPNQKGTVTAAVREYLLEHPEGAHLSDIYAAVDARLGPTPRSSIRNAVQTRKNFENIGRPGWYRLKSRD